METKKMKAATIIATIAIITVICFYTTQQGERETLYRVAPYRDGDALVVQYKNGMFWHDAEEYLHFVMEKNPAIVHSIEEGAALVAEIKGKGGIEKWHAWVDSMVSSHADTRRQRIQEQQARWGEEDAQKERSKFRNKIMLN